MEVWFIMENSWLEVVRACCVNLMADVCRECDVMCVDAGMKIHLFY
jgi:hypothetical protein